MTTVTITPQNDAGETVDTFAILLETFREGTLTVPSNTAIGYSNVGNTNIELFFSGQDIEADKTDPNNPIVTGGTINTFDIRSFEGGFHVLQDFQGFNGELDAKALYEAVLELVADASDTTWLDLLGAFDYKMDPSAGNVTFRGFAGDDTMFGGGGNDTFDDRFGNDSDVFNGGGGSDLAKAGKGESILVGGAGLDRVSFELLAQGSVSGITYSMKSGKYSAAPAVGASGSAVGFERVQGSASADRLLGNDAANTINGGAGNDTVGGGGGIDFLFGAAGNDNLNAGAGNDRLTGGLGRDILAGGAGADAFDFDSAAESPAGAGRDRIVGFVAGQDEIDLLGIDANVTAGGNQAFAFIGDDPFAGVAGQLRFATFTGGTLVSGDRNGDSVADFQIVLEGNVALTAGDFVL